MATAIAPASCNLPTKYTITRIKTVTTTTEIPRDTKRAASTKLSADCTHNMNGELGVNQVYQGTNPRSGSIKQPKKEVAKPAIDTHLEPTRLPAAHCMATYCALAHTHTRLHDNSKADVVCVCQSYTTTTTRLHTEHIKPCDTTQQHAMLLIIQHACTAHTHTHIRRCH